MAEDIDYISTDQISETFSIHFNLPEHQISLSNFIETANETQKVLQAFNEIIFDGKPQFEIYVLPPEDGTFLNKLKMVFIVGVLGLIGNF